MQIPFKSHPVEFNQHELFPSNIFDLLADEHECYLYSDIFQQLDTSSVESHYKLIGQNAYHPKLIISILIYAYSRGVFSLREIERRCNEDLSFMGSGSKLWFCCIMRFYAMLSKNPLSLL